MLAEVLTSAASWNPERPLLTYEVPVSLESDVEPGQLVAIPYGPRLVEGLIWVLHPDLTVKSLAYEIETAIRPLQAVLDPIPALLPHQMKLAEWMSEYYMTPLAQVALMMLPPGLMQRTEMVLRLAESDDEGRDAAARTASPRIQALIGLLLSDGELDVKRLKEMLGPTKADAVLKEVRSSLFVRRDAKLAAPRVKPRVKRIVRLVAQGEVLEQWRRRTEETVQLHLQATEPVSSAADDVWQHPLALPKKRRGAAHTAPDVWALPEQLDGVPLHTLPGLNKDVVRAQRQLAALELLRQSAATRTHWSAHALCKASGMTAAQLQQLVRENIVVLEETELLRDPLANRPLPASRPLTLTIDQQYALDCILVDTSSKYQPRPILLHGVTGSGKTEVYLQALAAVIARGKRGLILVPEIALTTQAILRVAGRFPGQVAIIHGELGLGERYDEWRRIRTGRVDIVIGARSAMFAPIPNLGLIIVDEEHEAAYKQSDYKPVYHARDTAIIMAEILQIPIVFGSATPSVETYYRAESGAYHLIEMPARIGTQLPPIEIVDLRNELHAGNTSIISRCLHEEISRVLEKEQQAILFLNRRGAASCVLCRDCGYMAQCEQCDIALTYHAAEGLLLCHYCGNQYPVLHFCPQCRNAGIRYFGLGTEKVQETIQRAFPTARLLRWDRDTARDRRHHEQLLDTFEQRQADILIGTQMIAKGLDLPGVTLVGVVSADIALMMPDYAATERAFTLLTQVAGRAGRGSEPGRVIIQTFNPQHFAIETASRHDYHEFYRAEIDIRQRYGYPPFRRFVKFTYSHENRRHCQNEALLLYERLSQWIADLRLPDTDIVGPAPALTERRGGKYHWQMIVRGPDLHRLLHVIATPGWDVDIDPINSL
jgi:primosomal protein N' (replication factor Y)